MLALSGGASALRLWSAEEPHLYLLLLSLVEGGSSGSGGSAGGSSGISSSSSGGSSGDGEVLEIEACQVGMGGFGLWRDRSQCSRRPCLTVRSRLEEFGWVRLRCLRGMAGEGCCG